jgi:hypothetical protein
MVSQDAPKAYPPPTPFYVNAAFPHPIVAGRDLMHLPHALHTVNARDEQRRPGHKLIPIDPDTNPVWCKVMEPYSIFGKARLL